MKQKIKDEVPDARPILERMGETSRGMVGNMSDIVWAINPVNDAAGALFKRNAQLRGGTVPVEKCNTFGSGPTAASTKTLDIESRKNVYLIFKGGEQCVEVFWMQHTNHPRSERTENGTDDHCRQWPGFQYGRGNFR